MTSWPFMCCPSFISRCSYHLVSHQLIHSKRAQSDRAQLPTSECMFLFGSVIKDNVALAAQRRNFKALRTWHSERTAACGKQLRRRTVGNSLPATPPVPLPRLKQLQVLQPRRRCVQCQTNSCQRPFLSRKLLHCICSTYHHVESGSRSY